MKTIQHTTTFTHFEDLSELPIDIQELMGEAISAREKAYAPYSNFKVGAAILLDNNKIVCGSNQENAAYPSGLCAERVAIFYAGANYPSAKILKIAITAASEITPTLEPIPPCGACRQAIAEYEMKQNQQVELYFMGATGAVFQSDSLQNLLPFMFNKKHL